jgi:hypothetical protein
VPGERLSRLHIETEFDPEIDVGRPEAMEVGLAVEVLPGNPRGLHESADLPGRLALLPAGKEFLFRPSTCHISSKGLGQAHGQGARCLLSVLGEFGGQAQRPILEVQTSDPKGREFSRPESRHNRQSINQVLRLRRDRKQLPDLLERKRAAEILCGHRDVELGEPVQRVRA